MRPIATFLSVLAVGLMPAMVFAADTTPAASAPAPFTDAQKAAVEDVVRELLTKKEPDLVIKAAQELQHRQDIESTAKTQQTLAGSHDKIFNDPNDPVGGNVKGDTSVVEFFDYQCGYCKLAQEAIVKLLGEDKNVRFVFKEFPILGPNSVEASKAALASVRQNKYMPFHDALLTSKDHLNDDLVFKIAKDTGLDVEKLKKDMNDPAIDKIIKTNQDLGRDVGARGTPTFVIGDQVYPGAMQYEQLKQAVDDARKAGKK